MFAMIAKFFSMLTYLFSMGEKYAKAGDIVADVAVDTAEQWRAEKRSEAAILIQAKPE